MIGRALAIPSAQRRRLLKAFAGTGLLAAIGRNVALAQAAPDYKALVCVNLLFGNDGENTLVRYDNAGYQNYASVRTPASGINIAQGQLLPIQPSSLGTPFGFHPACGPLKALFDQKQLAVVANMGMLAVPSTRVGLLTQGTLRPANMFSHFDQQLAIQSADHSGFTRVGWGGRIADRLEAGNPGTLFPALASTYGLTVFAGGNTSVPLTVGSAGGEQPHTNGSLQLSALLEAGVGEILALPRTNTYDLAAQLLADEGQKTTSVMQPIFDDPASVVRPFFANLGSDVASQLRSAALLIEGRAQTGLKRQIFSATQGGYDTHDLQASRHQALLSDLSQAIKAFQDAMAALGLSNNVTTFTISDFGRTFKPAANDGTDHGWGTYGFVIGGAVRGGDFYGTVPTLALDGPDDLGDDGRWIPTTSLEQYGAALARWLGIAEPDLPYIFPNLAAFPGAGMGFMS